MIERVLESYTNDDGDRVFVECDLQPFLQELKLLSMGIYLTTNDIEEHLRNLLIQSGLVNYDVQCQQ